MNVMAPTQDHTRMSQIFGTYRESLQKYLLRLTTGDHSFAEDLLQDTFVKAWRSRESLPDELEMARPWLFTVARHTFIDAARMRRSRLARAGVIELEQTATTSDHADRITAARAVRMALPYLNPRHREVLVELYYHDLTPRELAAKLELPEGTVRSRHFYALRCLAAIVGPVE